MGYVDSSTTVTAYSDINMIVRLNTNNGYIDVYNGDKYDKLNTVNVIKDTKYHVKMVTDLTTGKYSVWVTPEEGSETKIAEDYSFRASAPAIDDLGKLLFYSSWGPNLAVITNHTVSTPEEAKAAAISSAIAAIDALPATVTLQDSEAVKNARNLVTVAIGYGAIDSDITNLDKLVTAEIIIEELIAALKPFIITPVSISRAGGITATVKIDYNEDFENQFETRYEGDSLVVFQLMDGNTPVSIVATSFIPGNSAFAYFNVNGSGYSVNVFVLDEFTSDIMEAPTSLATPVTMQ